MYVNVKYILLKYLYYLFYVFVPMRLIKVGISDCACILLKYDLKNSIMHLYNFRINRKSSRFIYI